MKLVSVQVRKFKNILDSGAVEIDRNITCLVGKNESGKSAFLNALRLLNPAQGGVFSIIEHYPAWLEKSDRREMDLEEFVPVSAEFEFEDSDINALEKVFGKGVIKNRRVTVSRNYEGKQFFSCKFDEKAIVGAVTKGVDLPKADIPTSYAGLDSLIQKLGAATDHELSKARAKALQEAKTRVLSGQKTLEESARVAAFARVPKFFYYDNYSTMPGSVKIRELLEADEDSLDVDELTARSLLAMAGADDDYLLNPNYELRKRELQNVANDLTQQILNYWSTNPDIRVELDITQQTESRPNGQNAVIDELKVRLWDNRHSLSLSFDERSTGFRWFFSFLAAFSSYETGSNPVVILLDEPGLGLHARAQKDFLKFIEERLGKKRQVIYSTHSPFMVQTGKLEQVRLVEDKGKEIGSVITSDVLSIDKDTLFPLQSALGYDIAQHLFIAPHNLVVEGTSDFTYLSVISDHLKSASRTGLDERWSIVPVGGADLVPTFVALLGNHLEVTVLVDSQKAGHQRLLGLATQGLLKRQRILTIGETLGRNFADIEDLFEPADYLKLFNQAYGKSVQLSDLEGTDPILSKLKRNIGSSFDHGKPADVLLRKKVEILPTISPATFDNFEKLFQRVNETLGQ